MADKSKSKVIEDVKIILDENERTLGSLDIGGDIPDADQLETDRLIGRLIHVAIDSVNKVAPLDYLAGAFTQADSAVLNWEEMGPYCQKAVLPADFTRLVYVRLPGWHRGTSEFHQENDPLYAEFFSRYAGVRPTTLYPAAAIVVGEEPGTLEVVCCPKQRAQGDGRVMYVASADTGDDVESYAISDKCYWAVVYYVAHLYYVTLGESGRAALMETEAYRRLDIGQQTEKGDAGDGAEG